MEEINILLIIFISFLGGLLIGGIFTILLLKDNMIELEEELDKFRKLYFNEVDKWKSKYDEETAEEKLKELD